MSKLSEIIEQLEQESRGDYKKPITAEEMEGLLDPINKSLGKLNENITSIPKTKITEKASISNDVLPLLETIKIDISKIALAMTSKDPFQLEKDRENKDFQIKSLEYLKSMSQGIKSDISLSKDGQKTGGFFAGLVGGLTGLGKGIGSLGAGFAKGMTALGLGIGGFLIALGGTNTLLGYIGTDTDNIKKIMSSVLGAFDAESAALIGILGVSAVAMSKLKIGPAEFTLSMAALGGGIAGFLAGITLASLVADAGDYFGLDGSKVGAMLNTFTSSLSVSSAALIGSMAGMATMASVFSKGAIAKDIVMSMSALGAGIGGFLAGIALSDGIAKLALIAGLDGSGVSKMLKNFTNSMTPTVAAMLSGIGVFSLLANKFAPTFDPLSAAKSSASLGAAVAGFIGGIALADGVAAISTAAGLDGSNITKLLKTYTDSITPTVAASIAGLGIFSIFANKFAPTFNPMNAAKSSASLGASVAGFIGGIALADLVANISDAVGLDGSNITKLLKTYAEAMTPAVASMLAGLGTFSVLASKFGPTINPKVVATSTAALGASVAGFIGGMALADLVANISDAAGLDGSNITKLLKTYAEAMTPAVAGMLAGIGTFSILANKFGPTINPKGVATSTAALGAGVAGFIGGMALADGIAAISTAAGLDGTNVKTILETYTGSLTNDMMVKLAGMGAIAATISIFSKSGITGIQQIKNVATSTAALGAGVAGFVGGLAVADGIAKIANSIGLNGANIATILETFFTGVSNDTLIKLGGLVALSSILDKFGGSFNSVDKIKSMATSMGALGAGVAAFSVGIVAADLVANIGKAAGIDGSSLKTLVDNFIKAIGSEDNLKTIVGILSVGGILTFMGESTKIKFVTAMGTLGAGVTAFVSGLLVGDVAAGVAKETFNANGSSLNNVLKGFLGAFEGVSPKTLVTIAGAIAAATFAPGPFIIGMGALGAGISAFIVSMLVGEKIAGFVGGDGSTLVPLLTNIGAGIGGFFGGFAARAIKEVSELDGDKISKVGNSLVDLGAGLLSFAGGMTVGTLSAAADALSSFFGISPGENIKKFIDNFSKNDADKISIMGPALDKFASGMAVLLQGIAQAESSKTLVGVFSNLVGADDNIGKQIKEFINSFDGVNLTSVDTLSKSLGPLGRAMSDLFDGLGKSNQSMSDLVISFFGDGPGKRIAEFLDAFTEERINTMKLISPNLSMFGEGVGKLISGMSPEKSAIDSFIELVTKSPGEKIKELIDSLSGANTSVIKEIVPYLPTFADGITKLIQGLGQSTGFLDAFLTLVNESPGAQITKLLNGFSGIDTKKFEEISVPLERITGTIVTLLNSMSLNTKEMKAEGFMDGITKLFGDNTGTMLSSMIENIIDLDDDLKEFSITSFDNFVTKIANFAQKFETIQLDNMKIFSSTLKDIVDSTSKLIDLEFGDKESPFEKLKLYINNILTDLTGLKNSLVGMVRGIDPAALKPSLSFGTEIETRAAGGPVQSRMGAYLVGESGPELYIPKGQGDIFSTEKTNIILDKFVDIGKLFSDVSENAAMKVGQYGGSNVIMAPDNSTIVNQNTYETNVSRARPLPTDISVATLEMAQRRGSLSPFS